jgi:preprotein translocase subunit SecG
MTRATTIIAILFFLVCLGLAYVSSNRAAPDSVTGSVTAQEVETAPMQQADDMPPVDAGSSDSQESDLPPAE